MTGTDGTPPARHVVVVGGGPAAHRFVEAMASRDTSDLRVTVIAEEVHQPYDRVALSKAFVGDVDLTLGGGELWEHPAVTLRTGERAVAVDAAARTVQTTSGTVTYDELVLATGSDAARLTFPNGDRTHVYRTVDDVWGLAAEVTRLAGELGRAPRAVVVGGGLLGLEAAGGLQELGAEAAVVNGAGWLMNAQLDEGGGQALGRLIASTGIEVHCGVRPVGVLVEDDRVVALELGDGAELAADLVVAAIGIRPRDELAASAGLVTGPRGGVKISDDCSTSVPGIWAIGEVASFEGRCVGLVAPANTMAEVVADRLHGGAATFPGFDTATRLKLSGVDVASFGDAFGTTEHCLEIVYADPARGMYQKIVVTGDAKTLLGGIFVGDATPYTSLRPLLGRELGAEPGAFIAAAGGGEAPQTELPDDAILCSCNNVAVGTARAAVHGDGKTAPCHDLGKLKTCTRAGTQCGSCVPMLKKLLEGELTKAGVAVSKAMCEHVPMSRAELFEGVRALGLTSFEEILARFGTGRGCDICKPAIGSILASQHTDYVLDPGRGALQDTNDRALANMQKDGSYSVVPRIPGGEITPEKLAVIAQVAIEFGLYTKITGGQRIDLFGARLDQLPEIWAQLVEAGFESGQAYGKALRNVKSCVGSTWCRFGVQDSVAMAIQLELRYRGLRAPHKFKMGVSGCARECAEARGKDVGVIATDTGWNLYVGGNGGFQPVHGQLLAKDLDDETLIRYVDRYLMYYIRTADRLQRTARWMEDLDGGVDHVHQVVVEDSLGIGADLEAAMALHVEHYEDEWAATLKDPDRLRRFRSFVNAPTEADDSTAYVRERGQRRPATAAERAGDLGPGIESFDEPVRRPVMLAGLSIPVRTENQEG
ncbi:nitrite reductase large subunit NirB [Sanguibacter inulinus]|uniref:assimilatory sulfite reductase (ferredoxin) n=1 Tax=Sanguibacter inulinus TaxID=60922 RepID=A0A853ENB3_9MICO|nr:nitrite reductase large subunit NirB [Sanguibacter inulinus]MBF0720895.1 nitrite reductase large subunit [Sanguibacter inulinus]NYS92040.1 nitrite reductase large subunit [Sanguibacter inulinus]